jgi:hypothetical protein
LDAGLAPKGTHGLILTGGGIQGVRTTIYFAVGDWKCACASLRS